MLSINMMSFPEGKSKALTLSYDDGVLQDKRLISLMNKYGIKGTFNLNSEIIGKVRSMTVDGIDINTSTVSEDEILELYKNHEIATHGSKHSALTGLGASALQEIIDDRIYFENLLCYMVRGHAYPFGLYDDNVISMLKTAGICYARTVKSTKTFDIPENFLEWNPTCHHSDKDLMLLAEKFCTQNALFNKPELFYLWGHSYEFDQFSNWNVIEEFFEYISKFSKNIWFATNIEVVDYINAYKNLIYSADGNKVFNPSIKTVWLNCTGKIISIPSNKTVCIS